MDIRFLSTFIEVANTRHFGKAAENLFLTQSAVSARIKLLEEYFQTTLFIRHRNSIQLTPAGQKLLPYAHQLSDTLNDAKRELQLQSGEYVVCGATQLASELQLTESLSCIHDAFPDWSVKAEVLTLDNLLRQLHERVIDVAFSSEPLKSEEVFSRPLSSEALGLYAINRSADQEVQAADFIAIDWGSKVSEQVLLHFPALREAKLRTNSLQLALRALDEEGGLAVLPQKLATGHPRWTCELLRPLDDVTASVYLSHLKTVKRSTLTQLIDAVIAHANPTPAQ